jgi:hypothetical protein
MTSRLVTGKSITFFYSVSADFYCGFIVYFYLIFEVSDKQIFVMNKSYGTLEFLLIVNKNLDLGKTEHLLHCGPIYSNTPGLAIKATNKGQK